jgi:hypothetical protein
MTALFVITLQQKQYYCNDCSCNIKDAAADMETLITDVTNHEGLVCWLGIKLRIWSLKAYQQVLGIAFYREGSKGLITEVGGLSIF